MKAKTILLLAGGIVVFYLLRKKQQPGPGPGQSPANPGGGILDDVLNIFSPGTTPASNIITLWPTLAQFPVNEVKHLNIPGLSAGVIVTSYSLSTYQPTYTNWLQVPILRQQMLNSINTWLQITGQTKKYK